MSSPELGLDWGDGYIHPLDTPIEPVTSLPDNRKEIEDKEQRIRDYWRGWEPHEGPPIIKTPSD